MVKYHFRCDDDIYKGKYHKKGKLNCDFRIFKSLFHGKQCYHLKYNFVKIDNKFSQKASSYN